MGLWTAFGHLWETFNCDLLQLDLDQTGLIVICRNETSPIVASFLLYETPNSDILSFPPVPTRARDGSKFDNFDYTGLVLFLSS